MTKPLEWKNKMTIWKTLIAAIAKPSDERGPVLEKCTASRSNLWSVSTLSSASKTFLQRPYVFCRDPCRDLAKIAKIYANIFAKFLVENILRALIWVPVCELLPHASLAYIGRQTTKSFCFYLSPGWPDESAKKWPKMLPQPFFGQSWCINLYAEKFGQLWSFSKKFQTKTIAQ
jgi:hypothetical protein